MSVAVAPTIHRPRVLEQARVLLVEPDRVRQRALLRSLRSIVGSVEARELFDDATNAQIGDCDVVAVEADGLDHDARERAARAVFSRGKRLLWLGSMFARADYAEMFARRMMTNLVARNGDVDAEELLATLRKLVEPGAGIFGL